LQPKTLETKPNKKKSGNKTISDRFAHESFPLPIRRLSSKDLAE
jgi:hypothetical protein